MLVVGHDRRNIISDGGNRPRPAMIEAVNEIDVVDLFGGRLLAYRHFFKMRVFNADERLVSAACEGAYVMIRK
jgi:hypothetical protein